MPPKASTLIMEHAIAPSDVSLLEKPLVEAIDVAKQPIVDIIPIDSDDCSNPDFELPGTHSFHVIDLDNEPEEEVFNISLLDCIMPQMYIPITCTYSIKDGIAVETVMNDLCSGLKRLLADYRFLAGSLFGTDDGTSFVKRGPSHTKFTVHIEDHTGGQFPLYEQLAERHIPASKLAALKASAAPQTPGDAWVSTNDCITALMWRAITRSRLPMHGIADPTTNSRPVALENPLDVRASMPGGVSTAYPGNVVMFSKAVMPLNELVRHDTFRAVAVCVRETVEKFPAWTLVERAMRWIASVPRGADVAMDVDVVMGLDALVTSWRVLRAYERWDFGFGPLAALSGLRLYLMGTGFCTLHGLMQVPMREWRYIWGLRKGAWRGS